MADKVKLAFSKELKALITANNPEGVKAFIEANQDNPDFDPAYMAGSPFPSPLGLAVTNGSFASVKLLHALYIRKGIVILDSTYVSSDNHTLMMRALKSNNVELFVYMYEEMRLSLRDNHYHKISDIPCSPPMKAKLASYLAKEQEYLLLVKKGNLQEVKTFFETNPNIKHNKRWATDDTPLLTAIEHGYMRLVHHYSKLGVYNRFKVQESAIKYGSVNLVKYLRKNTICDFEPNNWSLPALALAAKHGHLPLARFFIEIEQEQEQKKNFVPRSTIHRVEILWEAVASGNILLVRYLYEELRFELTYLKGEINSRGIVTTLSVHNTPCTPEMKTLLEGYQKNETEYLRFVAEGDHQKVEAFLRDNPSVNPNARTAAGDTPLSIAAKRGHIPLVNYFATDEKFRHEEMRADVNLRAQVFGSGNLVMVKHLIKKKILGLWHAEGRGGVIYLMDAAKSGSVPLVRYLIEEKKCNFSDDPWKSTAVLMHGVKSGSVELVQYLYSKRFFLLAFCSPSNEKLLNAAETPEMKKLLTDYTKQEKEYLSIIENGTLDDVLKYIQEHPGLNLLAKNAEGDTADQVASDKRKYDIVGYLRPLRATYIKPTPTPGALSYHMPGPRPAPVTNNNANTNAGTTHAHSTMAQASLSSVRNLHRGAGNLLRLSRAHAPPRAQAQTKPQAADCDSDDDDSDNHQQRIPGEKDSSRVLAARPQGPKRPKK